MSLLSKNLSAFQSRAFIGLGSNLDDPRMQLKNALREIDQTNDVALVRVSSFYETVPVGLADQPMFVNAVAEVVTTLSPFDLLAALQAIELGHARIRGERNGPRTLDLDILLFNDWALDEDGLVIPHPRMHLRAFVLAPLVEIAPSVYIPGCGVATTLFAALDRSGVTRWSEDDTHPPDAGAPQ